MTLHFNRACKTQPIRAAFSGPHQPREQHVLSKIELDIQDLMSSLRSTPAIRNQGIWDPSQSTLVGESYILVDDSCVLCIQDIRIFQPFRSRVFRGEYITFQYLQDTGNYFHLYDGQVQQVRSGSVSLTAAQSSITEIRQLRPAASIKPSRAVAIHVSRDHLIETFGLRPDLWREEYRSAFIGGGAPSLSIGMPLTPEMWITIDAVLDCDFDEPVRNNYLKAKAVELLALTVVQFNGFDRPGGIVSLGSADRDQRLINIASLIYRREINNPPSIDELSRRVGLNRNKLTTGFRSSFGITPAEYSRRLRLDWAARRLSEGLDVRQVAIEAGYDSVAAFGRAFRQRYGRVPTTPPQQL